MIRKSYYGLEPGMTFVLPLCNVYKARKVDCVRDLPVTVKISLLVIAWLP